MESPYHLDPKGFETLGNSISGVLEAARKPFAKRAAQVDKNNKKAKKESESASTLSNSQFTEPTPAKLNGPTPSDKRMLTIHVRHINEFANNPIKPDNGKFPSELLHRRGYLAGKFGGKQGLVKAIKAHKDYNPSAGIGY